MRKQQGFTLIEIILYIGLISLMLGTLLPFFLNTMLTRANAVVTEETNANARYLAERIKNEIRYSSGINTGTSNFGVNLASNSSNQLSLVAAAPNNPTIINVLNGKVQIKQGASSAVALNSTGTTVTDLTFTNNTSVDNKTKNITFTLTVISNYTQAKKEYTSTVTLRNSVEVRNN